jgi:hypothetical protein
MTKEEMIAELQRLIKEVGSPTDNTNRGLHEQAKVTLQAMSLLADLEGWKDVGIYD